MQMENRYRLSEQRLTIAQQDHEAAHNDYYDVRISLFELDEAWTQAKLCKNFVNLMTSLNQVKGKREARGIDDLKIEHPSREERGKREN